jgi:pimeloyl-ACP methyl ester carboxylesterase
MAYFTHDSLEFYYAVQGHGQPLILIHGLGSSSRDWEFQVDSFAEHFQVITLDLRGHGRSSKPKGPYSIRLFAEDTARLIKELGLPPGHVQGISLGGMVAFQLALVYPDLVRSLVITNSTPDMVPRSLKEKFAFWQRFLIVRLMGMEKMGRVLAQRFLPHPDQEQLRRIFTERWAENDKTAYLKALKGVIGWSVMDQLAAINCPALIIGADGDYFPTEEKEKFVSLMPNAQLVIIENSMHALPAEKPVEYNKTVLDFLLTLP